MRRELWSASFLLALIFARGWVTPNQKRSAVITAIESTKIATSSALLRKTSVQKQAAKRIRLSNEGFLLKKQAQLNKMKLKDATSPLLSKDVGASSITKELIFS